MRLWTWLDATVPRLEKSFDLSASTDGTHLARKISGRAWPDGCDGHVESLRAFGFYKENDMLYYSAVFLVIALVAALFGFGGIAAGAVEIAKIIFVVFLVLFLASLIAGLIRRGR